MSEDRVAVVTGCGSGIGRSIFDTLLANDWSVVGIELAEEAATLAADHAGSHGAVIVGDVMDRAVLREAADLASGFGTLLGWVNNAALALSGNLHEPNIADVERLFGVNLMAYFWGCSVAIRSFLASGKPGRIVNVSSIHGTHSFAGWAAYDTAKGGVDALTRYAAVEYGPVNIRVNAVAPGAIRTALLQQVIDDADDPVGFAQEMASLHPLNRIGETTEIASAVAYLLSDDSSFVSGQVLAVDGAATARCYIGADDSKPPTLDKLSHDQYPDLNETDA